MIFDTLSTASLIPIQQINCIRITHLLYEFSHPGDFLPTEASIGGCSDFRHFLVMLIRRLIQLAKRRRRNERECTAFGGAGETSNGCFSKSPASPPAAITIRVESEWCAALLPHARIITNNGPRSGPIQLPATLSDRKGQGRGRTNTRPDKPPTCTHARHQPQSERPIDIVWPDVKSNNRAFGGVCVRK